MASGINIARAPSGSDSDFASSYTRAQTFLEIGLPGSFRRSDGLATSTGRSDRDDDPERSSEATEHNFGGQDESLDEEDDDDEEVGTLLSDNESDGDIDDDILSSIESSPVQTYYGDRQTEHYRRFSERSSLLPRDSQSFNESYNTHHGVIVPSPPSASSTVVIRPRRQSSGSEYKTRSVGQSTVPQTIFNSVNTLMGIGLLSLPFGFKYSGLILGVLMLAIAGGMTFYTALLLQRCLDADRTLVSYGDIGQAAWGTRGRLTVSLLFTVEILAAAVSLVVILADSLNALVPAISTNAFKVIIFFLTLPSTFMPLRVLSLSSIVGIFCTVGLMFVIIFNGIYKPDQPGSLRQIADVWLWPRNWRAVPFSIGIFLAPWGGHSIFPNIYCDLKRKKQYRFCLLTTYSITYTSEICMGIVGFLMFGAQVSDEISRDIIRLVDGSNNAPSAYPLAMPYIIASLISLVSLSKLPLMARPIIWTLDSVVGASDSLAVQFFTRLITISTFVGLAIWFPKFDQVIAVLGALLCTIICLILPVLFYLTMYRGRIGAWELAFNYGLLAFSIIIGILGTVWALVPGIYS